MSIPTNVVAGAFITAALTLSSHASAQPRVWTWFSPAGVASPDIIPMVRLNIYGPGNVGSTGTQAADLVCDEILARNLQAGQISILLQNFGRGDGAPGNVFADGVALFWHQDDQLAPIIDGQPVPYAWQTPWKSHGVAETSLWFAEFIARYKARQLADHIPAPTRFHFDTESYVTGCCDTGFIRNFDLLQHDSRWNDEPLLGNDLAGLPRSLKQIYGDAGSPPYDLTQPIDVSPLNRAWFKWYSRVTTQAVGAAMNEAVWKPIRTAWPGCRTSDYGYGVADGATSPKNPPFTAREIIDGWQDGATWRRTAANAFTDFDAPSLYSLHQDHLRAGETMWDAAMRVHRFNIESHQHSSPARLTKTTPWLTIPGQTLEYDFHGPGAPVYTVTKDDTRRTLALLRAKGVEELLVWASGAPATWQMEQFSGAVSQVWGANLATLTVSQGSATGSIDALRRSHYDFLSAVPGPTGYTELLVTFATNFQGANTLQLNFEHTRIPPSATGYVAMRNRFSGMWEPILDITPGASRVIDSAIDRRATGHIEVGGDVQVKVALNLGPMSAGAALYDLLQLIRLDDRCRADVNQDGSVDGLDVSDYLNCQAGVHCLPQVDPDFDCNGLIDDRDVDAFFAAWESGC